MTKKTKNPYLKLSDSSKLELFKKKKTVFASKEEEVKYKKRQKYLSGNEFSIEMYEEEKRIKDETYEKFKANAFPFFNNGDRILSDSRLYLAHTYAGNSLYPMGGISDPPLGVYVEFWRKFTHVQRFCERDIDYNIIELKPNDKEYIAGTTSLIIFMGGSGLSGCHMCTEVLPDGLIKYTSFPTYKEVWSVMRDLNERFSGEKGEQFDKYQAYTIDEAIEILKNGEK